MVLVVSISCDLVCGSVIEVVGFFCFIIYCGRVYYFCLVYCFEWFIDILVFYIGLQWIVDIWFILK